MKTFIVLAAALAVALAIPADTYNTKYDDFDADELVENKRLLMGYANCFLGVGPCTAEGYDFRKIIPDALKTKCAKCTPKQRQLIRKVCRAFEEKLPDLWEKIKQKEDPNGEYKEFFEQFLKSND